MELDTVNVDKTKKALKNVFSFTIGYGIYSIADELVKKKLRKLYFNKSIIGKFSITSVEIFAGICAWEYSMTKLERIL